MITEIMLSELRESVMSRLSPERYAHTLGVERAAARLGQFFMPDRIIELRAAALLHDIAKEMPHNEQMSAYLRYCGGNARPPVNAALHAFAGPRVIIESYPDFAIPDILDAVFNHTLGKPDMSVFSEIIFVADFVEDGRVYESCRVAREELFSALENSDTSEQRIRALHTSVVHILEFTVAFLEKRGIKIDEASLLTKNAYEALI